MTYKPENTHTQHGHNWLWIYGCVWESKFMCNICKHCVPSSISHLNGAWNVWAYTAHNCIIYLLWEMFQMKFHLSHQIDLNGEMRIECRKNHTNFNSRISSAFWELASAKVVSMEMCWKSNHPFRKASVDFSAGISTSNVLIKLQWSRSAYILKRWCKLNFVFYRVCFAHIIVSILLKRIAKFIPIKCK